MLCFRIPRPISFTILRGNEPSVWERNLSEIENAPVRSFRPSLEADPPQRVPISWKKAREQVDGGSY